MGRALHIHSKLRHKRVIPLFSVWNPLPKGFPMDKKMAHFRWAIFWQVVMGFGSFSEPSS